jgi:hypothetical protein
MHPCLRPIVTEKRVTIPLYRDELFAIAKHRLSARHLDPCINQILCPGRNRQEDEHRCTPYFFHGSKEFSYCHYHHNAGCNWVNSKSSTARGASLPLAPHRTCKAYATRPVIRFLFSSVQLFFTGVLGEYIAAIHTQVQHRPLVIEKERINF